MRTNSVRLAASLLALWVGSQAPAGEPVGPAEAPAEQKPGVLQRIRDRWVQRAQATTQPRRGAPPPGSATPTDRPPAAAGPAQPAAPARPTEGATAPGRAQPAAPARPAQEQGGTAPPSLPALPSATPSASPATPPGPPTAQPAGAAAVALQPGIGAALNPSSVRQEGIADLVNFQFDDPLPLLGDLSPLTVLQTARTAALHRTPSALPPTPLPRPPRPGAVSQVAPSTHSFKIADNQSPMPQDRAYFTFNYFDNVNGALNRHFDASVQELRAYRYIFGLEKTFNEGKGSVGIQLPLDSLTAESTIRGSFAKPGGTSNSLDDLTVFAKYILEHNPITGSLISVGLAVTPRTGPPNFAGANYLVAVNDTTVQPFLGYLWRRDRFYLHGFVAVDMPTSIRDVTMVYNDIGIGYYAYRNPDPNGLLMALVPTFEVHVNDPLTHGDFNNRQDLTGTPDIVNLTYGLNTLVGENSVFTVGFVTPVTGPRPFNYEIVGLINIRFGRTRGPRVPLPVLGG